MRFNIISYYMTKVARGPITEINQSINQIALLLVQYFLSFGPGGVPNSQRAISALQLLAKDKQ